MGRIFTAILGIVTIALTVMGVITLFGMRNAPPEQAGSVGFQMRLAFEFGTAVLLGFATVMRANDHPDAPKYTAGGLLILGVVLWPMILLFVLWLFVILPMESRAGRASASGHEPRVVADE